MAILSPTPFLPPHNVRFRRGDVSGGECSASECTLIAGDFWKAGFGRVQVVPSVQVSLCRRVEMGFGRGGGFGRLLAILLYASHSVILAALRGRGILKTVLRGLHSVW